jgi:hypothetical protein
MTTSIMLFLGLSVCGFGAVVLVAEIARRRAEARLSRAVRLALVKSSNEVEA